MRKKLTITVDERVYTGLHRLIGRRHISHFIETLVRPHVLREDLDSEYRRMAREEARETEALEWADLRARIPPAAQRSASPPHARIGSRP